jgi:hypothetical protein
MNEMRQIKHLFGIMLTMGIALSVVSCAKDYASQDDQSFAETDKVTFGIIKSATWDDPDVIETQTKGTSLNVSALNKFNVLANITGFDKKTLFFFKQGYTKSGSDWTSENIYYWPGSNWKIDFYATNAEIKDDATIEHAIVNKMVDQKDIIVAKQQNVEGDYNKVVGLSFDHILTAVSFKIGSIPYGNIKAIRFENIYTSGVYDMTQTKGKGWSYPGNKIGGCEFTPGGTGLSPDDLHEGDLPLGEGQYFFMIPQTLGDSAKVVIEFADGNKEKNFTLTKNLSGQEWEEGESVTYTMNIYSFDYEDGLEIVDAHYVMPVLKLSTSGFSDDSEWQIEVSADVNTKSAGETPSIQLESDVNPLVPKGYWTDTYTNDGSSARGSSTIRLKGNVSKKELRVFIPENISDKDRNIYLSYKKDGVLISQDTIIQKCPAWNNGIGVERIEDEDYQWGFNWDSSMKITYKMPSGFVAGVYHVLFLIFEDTSYLDDNGNAWFGTWKVTVDFSKIPKLTTATSTDDGLTNTWDIYTFEGVNDASTIMSQLEDGWGGVPDKTLPTNPSEFAAWACARKNSYKVTINTKDDEKMYTPVLEQEDLKWYLPAKEEAKYMTDDTMSGDYWTSTAITDPGTTSYRYKVGGDTAGEDRNEFLHVRAVRKK